MSYRALTEALGGPHSPRFSRFLMLLGSGVLLWLVTCVRESPETFIRQFESMNSGVRTKAGNELIRFDADEVVPLLVQAADDELVRVRFEVMKMLGRFRDPRGVQTLIRALDDRSPRVAAVAAASLSAMRVPEALPALMMYARDPSLDVRRYVIAALGACHSYAVSPALSDSAHGEVLHALQAAQPKVRMAALQSVREFGYRGAIEQLLEMADDPSPEARHVVVQALGEVATIRKRGDVEALRGVQGRPAPTVDPIEPVAAEVRTRIVDLLIERLVPDEYQSIRTKAIRGLEQIGDRRAIPPLERLREEGSEEDRREVRRALDELREEEAAG
ncbi:MAG: HEAT repeat domain-containing protein [Gemmatimonadetes bacterium]|nr:HEAT repeat domain-containing protein [Gemmatimonadota bacterium]